METNCSAYLEYCNCSFIIDHLQCDDVYIYNSPLANYIIYSFLAFAGILIGGIIIFNITLEYIPDSWYRKIKRNDGRLLNSESDTNTITLNSHSIEST
jgi:hypothetical protein